MNSTTLKNKTLDSNHLESVVSEAKTIMQNLRQGGTMSNSPKSTEEILQEFISIMAEVGIKPHANVSNEELIFGLQHTLADYSKTNPGAKFPVDSQTLSNVVSYYRAFANKLKEVGDSKDLIPLWVEAVQDLKVTKQEYEGFFNWDKAGNFQRSLPYVSREERREEKPNEVNNDPRLLTKDPDGKNETLTIFIEKGVPKIFMKQYLGSLFEPISSEVKLSSVDNNSNLPNASKDPSKLIKNN